MSTISPIPSGRWVQSQWEANKQASAPVLPTSWTATVLLSPFGDSSSSLKNYSQLVVGSIEYSWGPRESSMRVRLYLTQDQTFFDFAFVSQDEKDGSCQWYWIDSTPAGRVNNIYGPLTTCLQIPSPTFFSDMQCRNEHPLMWGNKYPLMCTDTNPKGIDCDHWADGRSWYAFRRETGNLFRILTMDSGNPERLPILGAYYIANLPTLSPGVGSSSSLELIQRIRQGAVRKVTRDLNDMLTQEDIHRAMADPLASASCTLRDMQAVLPGFIPKPAKVRLPSWTYGTCIKGWTLATDVIPYDTRVFYLWTGDSDSRQQTVFIGLGGTEAAGAARSNAYLTRTDACLRTDTTLASYEWTNDKWVLMPNQQSAPPGVPYPDWLARDSGVVMGQIVGNSDFGLANCETLNLIAAQLDRGGGELAIFWVWFLENGVGVLFSEGNFLHSLTSHNLQLIDYNSFMRNAPLTKADFSGPFPAAGAAAALRLDATHGHPTNLPHRPRTPSIASF